uniref:Phytanoyl-CoA dioxygenase family protein n=1 Tax=Alexandrium catenella TaxID=2925 RepID=A0A7S1Q9Q7_ALECA|mmetsp:Transcript_23790/g.64796  ORF Transcript_23790/g.64796 Transcript_23790/m.64796 type:complete len:376 (+) Transcript_23790:92-1219(+)
MAAESVEIPFSKVFNMAKPTASSSAQWGRVIKHYLDKVRPSSDFADLPQPSTDLQVLQRDFMRWGYCLVKDALSHEEVEAAKARLLDQAEAERAAGVAQMGSRKENGQPWVGARQLVSNLASKGDIFRSIATFETKQGTIIEELMSRMLGKDLLIGSIHGVVVEQGAGLQTLHQDGGTIPMPHPPYPLYANVIYMYSDFSLENGGTYVLPGSHADASGANVITPETDPHELIRRSPHGLVSLTAPAGTCFVSDGRLIHAGAPRKAPGVRLGNNVYFCRSSQRQQENPYVSFCALDKASPKLRRLLGLEGLGFGMRHLRHGARVPVGELSMSRPEEFQQDFDFYYTQEAAMYEHASGGKTAVYKGPRKQSKAKAKL